MGTHPHNTHMLSDYLFGEVQRAVLETLLAGDAEALHVREIIRRCDVGTGAVQRELEALCDAGLIVSERRGNRVLYSANVDSPVHAEIVALLEKTSPDSGADTRPLPQVVGETVDKYGLLPEGAPVLAMVSGGADSTALLRLLADRELGVRPVRVLHVDHSLRDGSSKDAWWVETLCEELGVDCNVRRVDVAAHAAEGGLNLEDAGRQVRYRLAGEDADDLADACGMKPDAVRIATAHTRDDLVETVLMRLAQGAGHGALAGIRPMRGRVVRPLLDARRTDVVKHLRLLGQGWREDPTNADTSRLRARVRHELLPVFESINPAFVETLARSSVLLSQEDGLLQEMADTFLRDLDVSLGSEVALDLEPLRSLSRPMARRVLRTAITAAFSEASRLTFEHVDAMVDGIHAEAFSRDITGGLRASIECGKMIISRREGVEAPFEPVLLDVPGVADLGPLGRIEVSVVEQPEVTDDPDTAWIDAGSVCGPLTVNPPRAGDRMRPLGMTGTKKLSDMFTDAKIPARRRTSIPVVRDGERIVWVAGVRLSEEHKVRPETDMAIEMVWLRER